MQINLENKDYPFIFIESGKLIDEYNLALVIMHEIGHHHGIKVEKEAYAFAFNQYGVAHRIIGRTPELKSENMKSVKRGKEIEQFLSRFKRTVESFVIIDDDNDMGELTHRLVRTSPFNYGLTKEKADEAINLLLNLDIKPHEDSYRGMDFHYQFYKR
ncbi:HAD domain-containing protein [Cytobacillus massiliigabonensis]|uniref:HAD domain-containing protein n=1 Tax=Cytobacillus massiliigabonensis TaxID=1871011 RepID=UPI000C85A1E9|nr:HAD domain-containing protein [Cytobacillus massiliigabonensis]